MVVNLTFAELPRAPMIRVTLGMIIGMSLGILVLFIAAL